ncbi:MAG TPA: GDSL-type esterase/lipase family protein [Polyangiaceae bacterium]|nr:GDSL-type esterase/lipase family protein [Polyangiaceae bacterium]
MLDKSLAFALTSLLVVGCGDDPASTSRGMLTPTGAAGVPSAAGGSAGAGGSVGGAPVGTTAGTGGSEGIGPIMNGTGAADTGVDTSGSSPDAGDAGGGVVGALEWLPSWATTIQSTEPNNLPPALNNNTLRQFVWPTVSGQQIRIQLSNEKGSGPVDIQKVHIARAPTAGGTSGNSNGTIDPATDVAFTFSGAPNVTIPPGQTVWSDPLDYSLQEITLNAVTMQLGANVPPEITGHPGSRETSYIANGDAVTQQGLAGAQTRDRWYFINAIEVMAPSDAFAIAALGDSITDGYGVLNQFGRWPDIMTLAIQNDPRIADNRSVLNFGMGANTLTSSSQYQDAGRLRFERDVLTRDKIKWLIVFEAINDINGGTQAQPIINAYSEIIQLSHDKGILVYGVTITPNGANAVRDAVNNWIRTSGEFDAVIDFDALIRNPNDPNSIQPNFNNDGLHPSLAGYEAMGNSVDLSLFYEQMAN